MNGALAMNMSKHPARAVTAAAANFIRGSVRCAFPVATLGVWVGLMLLPQGQDVLRRTLERMSVDDSLNDLVFLGIGSVALGLSIWYCMRWLLGAQMRALRLTGNPASIPRDWLPRLCGAAAPALVAVGMHFAAAGGSSALRVKLAFLAIAVLLLVLFWKRGDLLDRFHLGPGRRAGGKPGVLPANTPLPWFTVCVLGWTLALSALLGVEFSYFALTLPRVVGTAAIAALALASINLFGSFILTYLPMRRGLPPLALWVLLYAALIGAFNDNHGGRPAAQAGVAGAAPVAPGQAWEDWRSAWSAAPSAPAIIIASEGGGVRAAYWTAAVLQELKRQVPGFAQHVFALSGVSGGSLGVAAWVASVRGEVCADTPAAAPPSPISATQALSSDFLAPAVAGLFYYDFAQRFIPYPFDSFDRSRGLEEGWEQALFKLPGQPFGLTIDAFYAGCPRLPRLLLNTTVAETGQRAILSPLQTDGYFVDTRDVMTPGLSASQQSMAGLVHHSARFPLISPAGSVARPPPADAGWLSRLAHRLWPDTVARLVDGGYFDNSGIQTALELQRQIAGRDKPQVLLLVLSNDAQAASPCGEPTQAVPCPPPPAPPASKPVPVWRWLHEGTSPMRGLYGVRDSHVRVAMDRAVVEFDRQVFFLRPERKAGGVAAPLGWSLSAQVRDDLSDSAARAVGKVAPLLARRLAATP